MWNEHRARIPWLDKKMTSSSNNRISMQRLQRSGRSLLAMSFLILLVACSGEPRPATPPDRFQGRGANPVFIISHGWHTGVMLQAPAAQQRIPQLATDFGDIAYLEFGWGERDFYEAADPGVLAALRAVFPGASVVHVVGIEDLSSWYLADAGVVKLCLNSDELAALLDFLAGSFELSAEGEVLPRGRSQAMGRFYNGAGRYHLANTCNVWTARALQSIGMKLSSGNKLTAGSVMKYLDQQPTAQRLDRGSAPGEQPVAAEDLCP